MNFKERTHFSTSQTLFTFILLVFFFTLLNGYLHNLVADYRADATLVLIGVIVEMTLVLALARRWIAIEFDGFEAAGFVVVVLGVWAYFIYAALPTLLPPTHSSDAVRVYQQVMFTYPKGTLVSWYPAGGTFVTAMLARWLGIEPLRVLHPVAASFLALSAGAVYGITCALLPPRPLSKIIALVAPALLFVPWSYFAGMINWEQYFFAQAFAQYFTLAALWYTLSYARAPRVAWIVLIGVALLGTVAAYPLFVVLPLALFGVVLCVPLIIARVRHQSLDEPPESLRRSPLSVRRAAIILGIFIALLLLMIVALQQGGILELIGVEKALRSEVGAGGVTRPSLDTLGGPVFLALAAIGAWFAWREGAAGKTILGLLLVWLAQLVALLVLQPFWQISGYRVDKTFYILVFPLAILATLALAQGIARIAARVNWSAREYRGVFFATIIVLSVAVFVFRPPKVYSPLTESEIQVAQWAKGFFNNTYQIAYLEQDTISAYWLSLGIWEERVPNEWFQWIPPGRKMGPPTFDEWYHDDAWQDKLLVRYLDEVPVKMRVVYRVGESAILEKEPPQVSGPMPEHRAPPHLVEMNFDNTLTILGYEIAKTTFAPGEVISITTHIQTLYPPPASVGWRVELVDRAERVVSRVEAEPFGGKYPLQRWPPGKYALEHWQIPLPSQLAPGSYDLRLALFRRVDGELIDAMPIFSTSMADWRFYAPLTRIKIPLTPSSADELRTAKPLHARVGDAFALSHYTLDVDRTTNRVHVTLYWQSVAPSQTDYTVFVHLLDASGAIVAQRDVPPRDGTYPTSIWEIGEIIKDEYELQIPANARAPFSLAIGMYLPSTQQRLPIGASDHIRIDLGF
ncbi:MAG: hypothetical protein N2559_02005 [Anaerolineae bacterium]|nr:hypothetical protein [Anaerolineae bacterium]